MAMHENRYSRIVITACILIIFILLCAVLSKDKIVVIQPYTQSQEVWVSDKKGSQEYKEAWALLFAQELGNVTPDTLEFLKQRLGAMISPRIYTEFMETLGIQAEQIKDDRITLRFVPLEFLKQRLGAMISPRIYTEFMETLGIQAEQIKDDRSRSRMTALPSDLYLEALNTSLKLTRFLSADSFTHEA